MMKYRQKVNLPQPQRNRTGTEHFVNLIITITVEYYMLRYLQTGVRSYIIEEESQAVDIAQLLYCLVLSIKE